MTIARILSLAIVVSLVDASYNFTIDSLLGSWYITAQVTQEPSHGTFQCGSAIVIKGDGDNFTLTSRINIEGTNNVTEWSGNSDGALYNINGKAETSRIIYYDNNIFVMNHINNHIIFIIFSRNLTVPENVLTEYINKAHIENFYFEYVNNFHCNDLTLDVVENDKTIANKISGKWYMILSICPHVILYESSCANMNVSQIGDTILHIKTYKRHNTIKYIREWTAKIYNTELIEIHKDFMDPPVYSMTFINNDWEIYINNTKNRSCDAVWSRTVNISDELLVRYKKIANRKKWAMRKIDHKNC